MKKVVLICTLVLCVAHLSYSGEPDKSKKEKDNYLEEATIYPDDEHGKYNLVVVTRYDKPVRVAVYNSTGNRIHYEAIQKPSFRRKYDFSTLRDGKYLVQVFTNSKVLEEEIDLDKSSAKTMKVRTRKVESGSKFHVAVSGVKTGAIGVNLYDEENNLIHSETVRRKGFMRVYDLNKQRGEKFRLEVVNNDHVVTRVLY